MRGFGQITPGLVESELTARGIYSETLIPDVPDRGIVIFPEEEVEPLQPIVTFPLEDKEIRDLVPIPPTPPVKVPFEIPTKTILVAGLIALALIVLPSMLRAGKPAKAAPRVRTYTEVL